MEDVLNAPSTIIENWNELNSIFDSVPMMTLNEGIDALNNLQVKQGQSLHDFYPKI